MSLLSITCSFLLTLQYKNNNSRMLKSMTGFGRAEQTVNDKTFLVEIKSLNGKQFEMQLRLPALLRPYEFEIRNILQEQLIRGTIDCMISIKQNGTTKPVV